MKYPVSLVGSADRKLEKVRKSDPKLYERLVRRLEDLDEDPRTGTHLQAPLACRWSDRIGDWRIIYTIDDRESSVLVFVIDHRSVVYSTR